MTTASCLQTTLVTLWWLKWGTLIIHCVPSLWCEESPLSCQRDNDGVLLIAGLSIKYFESISTPCLLNQIWRPSASLLSALSELEQWQAPAWYNNILGCCHDQCLQITPARIISFQLVRIGDIISCLSLVKTKTRLTLACVDCYQVAYCIIMIFDL